MKNTRTLRTFHDDCDLTLRYEGDVAHFEFWTPFGEFAEPVATLPAVGGAITWASSVNDLLEHYDEEKGELVPPDYAEDLRHLIDSYAAITGDRRQYRLNRKWYVWEQSKTEQDRADRADRAAAGGIRTRTGSADY